ncbi:Hypothetical predicted protein [Paramuricea clavata]|uniref:Uncharacterized protein n=1 Tax=Paramuricea clavata TaxID=317549 RepID=A0A6S7IGH6_PARCT|nr:Hypothetical predicted protein [Paramuricea clavata]
MEITPFMASSGKVQTLTQPILQSLDLKYKDILIKEVFDQTANLEILWKCSLLFGVTRPSWSGMMQTVMQICNLELKTVKAKIEEAHALLNDLIGKKKTVKEVIETDILKVIKDCVNIKRLLVKEGSCTASLWLQYMRMVDIRAPVISHTTLCILPSILQ